jgi:hypothetical protein
VQGGKYRRVLTPGYVNEHERLVHVQFNTTAKQCDNEARREIDRKDECILGWNDYKYRKAIL